MFLYVNLCHCLLIYFQRMIVQLLEPLLDHVTLALFLTVIALALYTKLRHRTEEQRWPEGPPTVPILGNLPQLLMTKNLSMIEFMEDNRKKYGNVSMVEIKFVVDFQDRRVLMIPSLFLSD